VRYFSGTAVYSKQFTAPEIEVAEKVRLLLDLGEVRDLAEVRLNGAALGVVWKSPYRVDVTGLLKPGPDANRLEIAVTNEWTNRIVGDSRVEPADRVLSGEPSRGFGGPPREPLTSGLLGPVTIEAETIQQNAQR
jgi:hypothetical protein